jgi:hypothetical protein
MFQACQPTNKKLVKKKHIACRWQPARFLCRIDARRDRAFHDCPELEYQLDSAAALIRRGRIGCENGQTSLALISQMRELSV